MPVDRWNHAYVGLAEDGSRFFYSNDGDRWHEGTGPRGSGLLRVIAGRGTTSERCPAR